MNSRYVITRMEWKDKEYLVYAMLNDKRRLVEVNCERTDEKSILGNIYIGRVKEVVPNLNAAFIEIGDGITCYYSLEDYKSPLFTHKAGKKELCAGDELVVQVTKAAVKTKQPTVTTNLSFAGKCMVLTTENTQISASAKLSEDRRRSTKEVLEKFRREEREYAAKYKIPGYELQFGLIGRTRIWNEDVTLVDIENEFDRLKNEYCTLATTCVHKTAFTLLKEADPFYLKELDGVSLEEGDEVVTDCRDVYEELKASAQFRENQLRFYEDDNYPLEKLYSLEKKLAECLNEKVWLKSGAYLVISPTEALTVIDVNSGKNIKGKNPEENFLKINKEAAVEIARQLRVRNISGICIVDFINLKDKSAKDELMRVFRKELNKDRIPTRLIDITKLGLVEVTRKKVHASLAEQL